jgi:hypothetical protein
MTRVTEIRQLGVDQWGVDWSGWVEYVRPDEKCNFRKILPLAKTFETFGLTDIVVWC